MSSIDHRILGVRPPRQRASTHALMFSLATPGCIALTTAAGVIRCWIDADACDDTLDWLLISALFAVMLAGVAFVGFWLAFGARQLVSGPAIEPRGARTTVYSGIVLGLVLLLLRETWLVAVAAMPVAAALLFRASRGDAPR